MNFSSGSFSKIQLLCENFLLILGHPPISQTLVGDSGTSFQTLRNVLCSNRFPFALYIFLLFPSLPSLAAVIMCGSQ